MRNRNGIVPYYICSWLAAAVFFLQFPVSFGVKKLWLLLGFDAPNDLVYVVFTQIFAVGLPCIIFALITKTDFRRGFKLRRIGIFDSVYCVILGVAMQPVAMFLNIPLQILAVRLKGSTVYAISDPPADLYEVLLMIFVVCLVPAFFEELLVRGIILTSAEKYGIRFAVIVTSLLFVLLHNDFYSFAGLLLLGTVLSYSVLMTGSVAAGIIVHFSFNAFGVITDYLLNKYYQLSSIGFFAILAVIGLLLSAVAVFRLYNREKTEYIEENSEYAPLISFLNIPVIMITAGYILYIFR